MNKKRVLLLCFLFILSTGILYIHFDHSRSQKGNISWSNDCDGLVEYHVLEGKSSPITNWEKVNDAFINIKNGSAFIMVDEITNLELVMCSYSGGELYLKFKGSGERRVVATTLPSGEEINATIPLLGYTSIFKVTPKVKAEKIVIYIYGDINYTIAIPLNRQKAET